MMKKFIFITAPLLLILMVTFGIFWQKWAYLFDSPQPVSTPIVFGSKNTYTVQLVNPHQAPYRFYIRTEFLNSVGMSYYDLVQKLDYPYHFTMNIYLIHKDGRQQLINTEIFSEKRQTFRTSGANPTFRKCIMYLDLEPGKYIFEIHDHSEKLNITPKFNAYIDIAANTSLLYSY